MILNFVGFVMVVVVAGDCDGTSVVWCDVVEIRRRLHRQMFKVNRTNDSKCEFDFNFFSNSRNNSHHAINHGER